MKLCEAAKFQLERHRRIHKINTVQSCLVMARGLLRHFGDRDLNSISTEGIQGFLSQYTPGRANHTKRARVSSISLFFNHLSDNPDHTAEHPCVSPSLKRQFRARTARSWKALDKDVVDEVAFKPSTERNQLMLELVAKDFMRIGEVLKLTMGHKTGKELRSDAPKRGKPRSMYICGGSWPMNFASTSRAEAVGTRATLS